MAHLNICITYSITIAWDPFFYGEKAVSPMGEIYRIARRIYLSESHTKRVDEGRGLLGGWLSPGLAMGYLSKVFPARLHVCR